MTTLTVKMNHLKAAVLFAGDRDTRQSLNGIYFDPTSNNVVSTDGHRIFVGAPDTILGDFYKGYILPRDYVLSVIKAHKGSKDVEFTIKGDKIETHSTKGVLIDLKFPEWRRVYPRILSVPEKWVSYRAEYMAEIDKAWSIMVPRSSNSPVVMHSDDGCLWAQMGDAHVGTMPNRNVGEAMSFSPFAVHI